MVIDGSCQSHQIRPSIQQEMAFAATSLGPVPGSSCIQSPPTVPSNPKRKTRPVAYSSFSRFNKSCHVGNVDRTFVEISNPLSTSTLEATPWMPYATEIHSSSLSIACTNRSTECNTRDPSHLRSAMLALLWNPCGPVIATAVKGVVTTKSHVACSCQFVPKLTAIHCCRTHLTFIPRASFPSPILIAVKER